MFVLFLLTAFVTLLLVSLDGHPFRSDRVMRQLRRGTLGFVSLAIGAVVAVYVLPSQWQLPLVNVPAAWAAAGEIVETPTPVSSAADSSDDVDSSDDADASDAVKPNADVKPSDDAEPSDDADPSDDVEPSDAADPSDDVDLGDAAAGDAVSATTGPAPFSLDDDNGFPHVTIPYDSRPEWVGLEKDYTGDVHRLPITAGPFVQKSECMHALDTEIEHAVSDYIKEYLGSPRAPIFISYDIDEIKGRLLSQDHIHDELIEVSLGPMHQVHALLEFDTAFRSELDDSWRDVQAGVRLSQTGLGAFGLLGLLVVVFGYFKLDTATRGYYSTRLQILASLAILSLIAAGMLFYGWIPQM
jgi:hypothetical protein